MVSIFQWQMNDVVVRRYKSIENDISKLSRKIELVFHVSWNYDDLSILLRIDERHGTGHSTKRLDIKSMQKSHISIQMEVFYLNATVMGAVQCFKILQTNPFKLSNAKGARFIINISLKQHRFNKRFAQCKKGLQIKDFYNHLNDVVKYRTLLKKNGNFYMKCLHSA